MSFTFFLLFTFFFINSCEKGPDISIRPLSPLLKKTGQTISYQSYDDGDYQIGINPNYTRNNDIVTDTITHLMWQDNSDTKSNRKNWNEAIPYCNSLSLGGHSDWQLPTVKELLSIVDIGKTNPSISDVFQNISSSTYWSSSSYVSNPNGAWLINFSASMTYYYSKTSGDYIRCVRGKQ